MKKNKLINISFITLIAFTFGLASCVDDLNVKSINPQNVAEFDQDAVFAKLYSSLALTGQQGAAGSGDVDGIDEGTSAFVRLIWNLNEITTDEAICSWGDPGIPEMNFNKWSASHSNIQGLYYRLYFDITLCNHFLENTEGKTDDKSVKQRAEARFLRALNYYYLLDMWGNVPFVTKVSTENPKQIKRADLYAWIETELKDIESSLYAPRQGSYYRVDQAADWLLLSRLYLNAKVYTGTPQWDNAAIYAKKVIGSGYTLVDNYAQLFMGDNAGTIDNSTVNKAPDEIIFAINADGVKIKSWGSSLFLIASTHTAGMLPTWGSSDGWGGNRARAALALKFFPNGITDADIATQTTDNGNTLATKANDVRAMFWGWTTDVSKGTSPYTISDYSVFKQGLSVSKYSNVRADGGQTSNTEFPDMDVPFMRVAEAYLTYAEAVLRGGASVDGYTAVQAVNAIRNRAHTTPYLASELTLDVLRDEWCREFYFEGRRRMDLIRFDSYGGSDYTWDWKGGTKAGTKFNVIYNLMPIPTSDLNANSNLVQNPGY